MLSDRIARGPLGIDDALRIIEELAGALADAHDRGIVHRDIKPANIILDRNGRPILLDFGLAKLTEHTKITKTGATVGTLAYMAPEQATGRDVDGRTDLFSLGVVFYELITGAHPFRGDHDAAVIYSVVHEPAASLATHDPRLPDALQIIVDRCLAKDPENRYLGANELKAAITDLKSDTQGGTAGAFAVNRGRGRRWLPMIAVLVLVLSSIVLWKFIPNRTGGETAEPAIAVVEFNDLSGGESQLSPGHTAAFIRGGTEADRGQPGIGGCP